MNSETWDAIQRRLVWYADLLTQRLDEWPPGWLVKCNDEKLIARYGYLFQRNRRHLERMKRHLARTTH